jgi:hypothetical protein
VGRTTVDTGAGTVDDRPVTVLDVLLPQLVVVPGALAVPAGGGRARGTVR